MGNCTAAVASRKMPTLAEVPISPAAARRDRLDQASATRATPLGHMPPTPVQARYHSTSSCHGVWAVYATAARAE
jgi:hypothetical protein